MKVSPNEDKLESKILVRQRGCALICFLVVAISVAYFMRWLWIEWLLFAVFASIFFWSGAFTLLPRKHIVLHSVSVGIGVGWLAGTAVWLVGQ